MSDHEIAQIGRFTGAYASCAQLSVLCTLYPHPPKRLHTMHPPNACTSASHLHITSRCARTAPHQAHHIRITRGFSLIRFALPMSKKVIRFELFSDRPRINTLKGEKRC